MSKNNRVEIRQKLFNFLRNNGCLREYITYIKEEYGVNYKEALNSLIDGGRYTWLITFPFTWSFTEEGDDYWVEIDKKWHEYCHSNFIE